MSLGGSHAGSSSGASTELESSLESRQRQRDCPHVDKGPVEAKRETHPWTQGDDAPESHLRGPAVSSTPGHLASLNRTTSRTVEEKGVSRPQTQPEPHSFAPEERPYPSDQGRSSLRQCTRLELPASRRALGILNRRFERPIEGSIRQLGVPTNSTIGLHPPPMPSCPRAAKRGQPPRRSRPHSPGLWVSNRALHALYSASACPGFGKASRRPRQVVRTKASLTRLPQKRVRQSFLRVPRGPR